jgi:hypothetical protein
MESRVVDEDDCPKGISSSVRKWFGRGGDSVGAGDILTSLSDTLVWPSVSCGTVGR